MFVKLCCAQFFPIRVATSKMPTALVEKLAEVIFLDLPLNGLERRRRPAQPQTLSAQFAAEGKSVRKCSVEVASV